jgi:hypothetical protein
MKAEEGMPQPAAGWPFRLMPDGVSATKAFMELGDLPPESDSKSLVGPCPLRGTTRI